MKSRTQASVGVRVVREVGRSPVVFGLRNVDLGGVIAFRSLVEARWFNFRAFKYFTPIFAQFHLGFLGGINTMLAALGQEIFLFTH